MPFAVCRRQRASGVFCSLSYTDASFFYTRLLVFVFGLFPWFPFQVVFFWELTPIWTVTLPSFTPPIPHPPPPSCNINHSNIRCMFTWIWSTKMFYDHVALPTGNQWQMQSGLRLLRPSGTEKMRASVWPNVRCGNPSVRPCFVLRVNASLKQDKCAWEENLCKIRHLEWSGFIFGKYDSPV